MSFKPLFVNLKGFRVVVFGGGGVGARRAMYFLESGAQVTVVSREFSKSLLELKERVKLVKAELKDNTRLIDEIVKQHDLVVVATSDPEVNRVISEIARARRRLVNNATDALQGNVIVPFSGEVFDGKLKFSVTSLGVSGIAARRARDRVLEVLRGDLELKAILSSMARLKRGMKKCIDSAKQRVPLYFEIERDEEYLDAIRSGNADKAYRRGLEILEQALGARVRECVEKASA